MIIENIFDHRYEKNWKFDVFLFALCAISGIILIFSFYYQYIENVEPCPLCKWQRWIYLAIFVTCPIGFKIRFNVFIRNALKCLFFIGMSLAAYHTLVQFGLLQDRCSVTQKINDIEGYKMFLQHQKTSCAVIGWKLFGLSSSLFNAIFSSLILFLLSFERYISNSKKLIHKAIS